MKLKTLATAIALVSSSMAVQAQNITVTIDNLTQGIIFTPFLIAAHGTDDHLFEIGTTASASLQMMAEGGDISGLVADLGTVGGLAFEDPAEGLLMPAASATVTVDTMSNGYLSLVAMLLPTNDGFVGLDGWVIPAEAGTYTMTLNAYDAGTEANDEIINGGGAPNTPGIPGAPGGNAGTGATGVTSTEGNAAIHIHRGAVGDDDLNGGISDLDNRIHRWLNPVIKLTVVVN